MSTFRVLDVAVPQERELWLKYWNSWSAHEVFAHPDYVSLFAGSSDNSVKCAVLDSPQGQVIFPFVLRPLCALDWFAGSENACDLIGPYGYGGAYAIGTPDPISFWAQFSAWATVTHVVTMFIRLSLFSQQLIPCKGEIEIKSRNVVRRLDLEPEAIWMDYEHKVRKNVKRARRNGLEVESDATGERLTDFLAIYYATMDRNDAADCYYFDESFFHSIIHQLTGHFMFFHVWHKDRIVSSELVLLSADHAYSFLGGTLREAYSLRPNDLLKHTITDWSREHGKQTFVLGGGYSDDDGIFRYKKAFSPKGVVPFKIAKWTVNSEMYVSLMEQRRKWEFAQDREWHPDPGFFPAYRS